MTNRRNITGQRFGRLVALRRVEKLTRRWVCLCDCGKEHEADLSNLRAGNVRSCGCLRSEIARAQTVGPKCDKPSQLRHGHTRNGTNSRTYASWSAMLRRCTYAKHPAYARYGGRGITVCERWRLFDCFLADMGERPAGKTLDRIDNDRGYEAGNCRWATPTEQAANTSQTRMLTVNGAALPITEWARRIGVTMQSLSARLRTGWSVDAAVSTPPQPSGPMLITVGAECLPLKEWARRSGVGTSTIRFRIKHGWPPAKAVSVPADPHAPKPRRINRTWEGA